MFFFSFKNVRKKYWKDSKDGLNNNREKKNILMLHSANWMKLKLNCKT